MIQHAKLPLLPLLPLLPGAYDKTSLRKHNSVALDFVPPKNGRVSLVMPE